MVLSLLVLSGCSSPEGLTEQGSEMTGDAFETYREYVNVNSRFFSHPSIISIDEYLTDPYCGYDLLFHELGLVNESVECTCARARVVLAVLSPVDRTARMSLADYDGSNYSRGDPYSVLLVYMFDEASEAQRFIRELSDVVEEEYKERYLFLSRSDYAPSFFSGRGYQAVSNAAYLRAAIPFIEYEGDIRIFHTVMFRDEERVIVHRIYSAEEFVRIAY